MSDKRLEKLKKTNPEEYEYQKELFDSLQGKKQWASSSTQINCPKCGSTQIYSNKKGWTATTESLGSSPTMCTCLKCGEKWKAGSI